MAFHFYAGGYAAAGEEGIIRYAIDFERGSWEREAACTLLSFPSYLLYDRDRRLLYCAEELEPRGRLSVLSVRENGFTLLRSLSTGGAHPCHLYQGGEHIFAANYTSGSLAAFPLDKQGLPLSPTLLQHSGHGPDPVRQEKAHIHFSLLAENILYVCDLGLDQVFRYRFPPPFSPVGSPLSLPAKSGPRHLCFHPAHSDWLYVVCEMGSLVCFLERRGKEWSLRQQLSLLPAGFSGVSNAAAVRMSEDGRYLLASNRGDDSIALFALREDGQLSLEDICKTGGKSPRDFMMFGRYLVAANQDSNLLSVLQLDVSAGKLSDTGMRIPAQRPSCICPC